MGIRADKRAAAVARQEARAQGEIFIDRKLVHKAVRNIIVNEMGMRPGLFIRDLRREIMEETARQIGVMVGEALGDRLQTYIDGAVSKHIHGNWSRGKLKEDIEKAVKDVTKACVTDIIRDNFSFSVKGEGAHVANRHKPERTGRKLEIEE